MPGRARYGTMMMELNAAKLMHEVATAAPEQRAKPAALSPLALMVAAQPIIDAKSPIELSGKVRRWSREGRLDRRAVLVGGGDPGEGLVNALGQQEDSEVRLLGVFDDRGDDRAPNFCGGLPKLGTVDDLVEFARRTRVDL